MKTSKFLIYLSAAGLILASCEKKTGEEHKDSTQTTKTETAVAGDTASYLIDTSASVVKWAGKKIVGDAHTGTAKLLSGEVKLVGDKIVGGTFAINMNSIQNDDVKDKEKNAKLIGHLKSEDFFNVAKFPSAVYIIKSVAGDSATGSLNIKNISNDIVIPFHATNDAASVKVVGKTTFDRTKWDVKFGSGQFFKSLGDKAIKDDVELEFDLVGKK